MIREYKTIAEVAGPLMLVKHVEGVTYDELGEIELPNGERAPLQGARRSTGDNALVQLFESAAGHQPGRDQGAFPWARASSLACREDMLGRVFDGMGRPDRRRPGDHRREAAATSTACPMNPAARDYPSEFIQTGVSAIDGLNTLVRGQKLPDLLRLRSAPCRRWPRRSPVRRRCWATDENFAVVFAAIGITFEEADYFISGLQNAPAPSTAPSCSSNLANDPAVERIATPAYGADRRRVPGIREGHARPGHPHRYHELRRGAA